MNITERTILSTDNIHNLYIKIFMPEGEIKGIFQIVHGMTEHIDRYAPLMELLAQNGYVAFGHNHLGHKISSEDNDLGYIADKDGYKFLINDVIKIGNAFEGEFSGLPHILFGHSMGSFIVRMAVENEIFHPDKLIICGTGGPNPAAEIGIKLCDIIKCFKGERHISETVYFLAFGAYNKRFERDSEYNWLSVNRKNIEEYENDKYCTFKFTVSAMKDLVTLNKLSNLNSWFKNFDKKLPTLIISGSNDPVGNFGKGVEAVFKKLKSNGCNVKLKLYKGYRHEILNDDCKEQVKNDILDFVKQ